jgi:sulfur-oxidizing protein SoxX
MRRLAVALLSLSLAAPAFGQEALDIFTRPDKGYCVACHQLPAGVGPAARNDVGPKLEGARMRALGKAEIRALIDDATKRNPESIMPPFGRHRILDAREIDRLTEFLHALP